ncbi:hypothetical protein JCM3765_000312 [Sporobolomyces pararoseus]
MSTSSTTTRTRSLSPSTPSDGGSQPPLSKRPRLSSTTPTPQVYELPYSTGMHLAPMVRIGTLPFRLLSLEFGAQIVWGPEIVDKAIIGSTRTVNPRTGVVSFVKNNRSIFECHPSIEKSRLIFQLGTSDPILAVKALKVIEQDVGGVGLNCGCPKNFSLQGGMGAALLKEPEKLCKILTALVESTRLPIDAKIRLLPIEQEQQEQSEKPSEEEDPTLPLIKKILKTGIKCLTVHCRTQTMRSSEPALHNRLLSINESLESLRRQQTTTQDIEEEWLKIPIVCNGDVTGGDSTSTTEEVDVWGNFKKICKETKVESVMIARGAESNPSCFRNKGLQDLIKDVIPKLLKIAILTNNHYSNTKYFLNALNLHNSPTPPSKDLNRDIKLRMNKAKNYFEMGEIFGITREEVERLETKGTRDELEIMLPNWKERREVIEKEWREKNGEKE